MIDPGTISAILFGGLVLLLAVGAPVSISIALPSALCMLLIVDFERGAITAAQQMLGGADSFALLAIPFFILAGVIMNNGGIAERLINLARVLVGRTPAPYVQTNVIANTIFGSVKLQNQILRDLFYVGQWQNGAYYGVAPTAKPGAKPVLMPKPAWKKS